MSLKTNRPKTPRTPLLGKPMNDVVPAPPSRYAHIKPCVNSGMNVLKVKDKYGLSCLRYRRDEFFHRCTAKKLEEMVNGAEQQLLVLDLRDAEAFEAFHIRGAVNYPSTMLSRAMYQFTPEIYAAKNKEDRLMILYDWDEKIAVSSGNAFYERGVDNFVVLSGGLMMLCESHPHLVEGTLPPRAETPRTRPRTSSSVSRTAAGSPSLVKARQAPPTPAGMVSMSATPASTPHRVHMPRADSAGGAARPGTSDGTSSIASISRAIWRC